MRTLVPILLLALMSTAAEGDEQRQLVRDRDADPRELAVLRGHGSEVVPVAFSPDGSLLASGSWDGEVKLWDAVKHTEVATLRGHDGRVGQMVFTTDGKRLAVAGGEEVRLWDVGARRSTRLPRAKWYAYHLTFSPNDQLLAYSDGKTVIAWDVAKQAEACRTLQHESRVSDLTFSSDGKKLAVADESWRITLWGPRNGKRVVTFEGHDDIIRGLRFSDDGRHLVSVAVNGVFWWDIAGKRRVASRPFTSRICGEVAFSRDGLLTASPDFVGNVHLVDLDRGHNEAVVDVDIVPVWDVTFSPDGKLLAWATRHQEIWLWDMKTQRVRAKLRGHAKRVTGLTFSPDGQLLASGSWDGTVRLWKAHD